MATISLHFLTSLTGWGEATDTSAIFLAGARLMTQDAESSFRHLLDAARGAASAYRAAASPQQAEQYAQWLRQNADEHEQNVRLLVPHIESMLQAKAGSWLTAFVEGGKATIGRLIGPSEMYGVLEAAEQKLIEALDAALSADQLPIEVRSLCDDQRASAKMRQGQLKQRLASIEVKSSERVVGHGEQGHTADTINKPKAPSSENSDC